MKLRITRRSTKRALEDLEAGTAELAGAAEEAARGRRRAEARLDTMENAVAAVQEASARQVELLGRLSEAQAELRAVLQAQQPAAGAEKAGRPGAGGARSGVEDVERVGPDAAAEATGGGTPAGETGPSGLPAEGTAVSGGDFSGGAGRAMPAGQPRASAAAQQHGTAQARAFDGDAPHPEGQGGEGSVLFRFE